MALNRRNLLYGAAGILLAGALPAFGKETFRLSGRAYGTSWQATLRGDGDVEALARDLAADLARVDLAMSPFRPDSALTRFNLAAAGWHEADADFVAVTAEALRVAALTRGAFDPSVGPDVGRYGFGPIDGQRAGNFGGFATHATAISKADALLTLDLCGIAKGFALDLMAARIAGAGYRDFLVELGGEVVAAGADTNGAPWQVGIAHPLGGLHTVIDAGGLAVATSGDAINAYEVGGRRYSHIIDPATDEPVVNDVASVTVLAPSAMTADALATALMVMGPEQGMAFAEAHALPVLYLLRSPDGLGEVASRSFDAHRLT
jgi:thiamine biosynthesis lipoprotein